MSDQEPETNIALQEGASLKEPTPAKKPTKAQKRKASKATPREIIDPTRRPGFYDQYAFSSVMGGSYKPYDRQPAGRPKQSKLPKLGDGVGKAPLEEYELSPQSPDNPQYAGNIEKTGKTADDYDDLDGEDDGKWQMGNGIGSRSRHQLSRDITRPKGC